MSRKFKIGGSEKSLRQWWDEKVAAEKAKSEENREKGWKEKIADAEDDAEEFKNVEFKINKKGEMEPVTDSNPLGVDDIKITGSKSSLRRIADLERNVTVLANRISTIDTEADINDGSEELFDNWITEDTAFTKNVTLGRSGSTSWWGGSTTSRVDVGGHLYINNGITLGSTAQEVISDLVGGMWSGNTESGISVTYKDTDNTLDIAITKDSLVKLTGDVTGEATMTNLGDVTITTYVGNDSHTHKFSNLTNKPTTLAGYGITDAAADTAFTGVTVNNDTLTFTSAGANDISVSISDANTWRPVVDGLTSSSTTSSLSAKQGKLLSDAIGIERSRIDTLTEGVDVATLDTIVEIQNAISQNQDGITALVAKTSAQALRATNALTVSNDTITLHKGDGSTESVTISDAYENYAFWTAKDHDGTTYPLTSNDVLWFKEGSGMDVNFTADDVLTFTNTDRGSSQYIFKNVAVSGQSTIVADNNNDTLTFVGGTNVTITTNASTDTLTIAATDTNTWRGISDTPGNDSATSISRKWAQSALVNCSYNSSGDILTFTKGDGTTFALDIVDNNSNTYITGLSFNTGNGVLTATRNSGSVTVDLDGRYQLAGSYLTSYTETDTLQSVTSRGNTTNKDIIMTSTDATTRLLQVGKSTNGSQGTGAIEVTQDGSHGGGISYNGDGTPGFVSSEGADRVTFYRMTTGTRSEVFSYAHNSDLVTFNGDITVSGGDVNATRFNGTATYAKYADLAERYAADAPYAEGTVVVFGGEAEVTASTSFAQRSVAGVVSLRPAVAMNAEAGNNETHPFIALQGRVPVKVTGDVKKGDILVASDVAGTATAWTNDDADPRMTAYIGIAIADAVDGFVEVKVGK